MHQNTYKTRLFRRLTETSSSLPDSALLKTFAAFSPLHAQLLLSLLPMNTISRLSYLVEPTFFEHLPTKEIPETQATRLAKEMLGYLNQLCVTDAVAVEAPAPVSDEKPATAVKVLDFIARRMGRLTIKP